MNTKKIILLSLVMIVVIAGVVLFSKFRSNPIVNTPSPVLSPQSIKDIQTFIDEEHGISFEYPHQFIVNAGMDFRERYAIHLKLKDQPNDTNHLNWDIDAMKFAFSKDKIEDVIRGYREDKTLDNLVIDDILIGNLHGKKVSFTGGIGDAVEEVLLLWKGNILLEIVYFPPYGQETKNVYQKIIMSIRQIN